MVRTVSVLDARRGLASRAPVRLAETVPRRDHEMGNESCTSTPRLGSAGSSTRRGPCPDGVSEKVKIDYTLTLAIAGVVDLVVDFAGTCLRSNTRLDAGCVFGVVAPSSRDAALFR